MDDLCNIFIKAIEDHRMEGAYNAVAPNPVTNRAMTRAIAKTLNKPLVLPPIPGFVIRLAVGEIAEVVLNGSVVSSRKIQETGFIFEFPSVDKALENLLLRQPGKNRI
jgi:NAD dependent epimerase/dehydratase family enzyme